MPNLFARLTSRAPEKRVKKKSAARTPNIHEDLLQHGGYHVYWQNASQPVWSPREFRLFAEEGFIKNVIAHRSIEMIATGAASIPWRLYAHQEQLTQHPLLQLLARPNPLCAGTEFFENLYAYRLISGNSYIQLVAPNGGMPQELHLLRPDRVSLLAGSHTLPMAYRYTIGNSYRDFRIDPFTGQSDILHLKNFHPLNDWYGLSPIEAAAYAIDQHNQASEWNQALLQNGARPSGALVVKTGEGLSGHLSDEQFQRLRMQFDSEYSGAKNAGRPLLLEGGLDWQEMSLTPKDMDYIETKHSAARDIALALGVPPQLLGIPGDNTYSNLAEARLALWEQTILPLVENITHGLNHWLVRRYGEGLELRYNTDTISALALRREAVWNRLQNANFMTLNEKRAAVGLSPVPNGDIIL